MQLSWPAVIIPIVVVFVVAYRLARRASNHAQEEYEAMTPPQSRHSFGVIIGIVFLFALALAWAGII